MLPNNNKIKLPLKVSCTTKYSPKTLIHLAMIFNEEATRDSRNLLNRIISSEKLIMPRACFVSNSPFLLHIHLNKHSSIIPRIGAPESSNCVCCDTTVCQTIKENKNNNNDEDFIIKLFVAFADVFAVCHAFRYHKSFVSGAKKKPESDKNFE